MMIRIQHDTQYRYSDPVLGSIQYLRLTPQSGPTQTVHFWKVGCDGAHVSPWTDHLGNLCHTMVVSKATESIVVRVAGAVETRETDGVTPVGMTPLPPEVYLRETAYTAVDSTIRKFTNQFRRTISKDLIEGLHGLMVGIHETVAYEPGETHVRTTAGEALTEGRGVCQDQAHIFIAACRHLDVPARYVSGYLCSGNGPEQHAASHAWAEAIVPELGWISFDPANCVSATQAYVRTAVGLDYGDAGPVRGVRTGGGTEDMTVMIHLDGQQ